MHIKCKLRAGRLVSRSTVPTIWPQPQAVLSCFGYPLLRLLRVRVYVFGRVRSAKEKSLSGGNKSGVPSVVSYWMPDVHDLAANLQKWGGMMNTFFGCCAVWRRLSESRGLSKGRITVAAHPMARTAAVLAACAVLMLSAADCSFLPGPSVGQTRTISKTVPLGKAKSVAVDINMGAGKLKLGSGTSDLMNADFTYNVEAWKPEVSYEANGDRGHLTIKQPSGSHNYTGSVRYDWDVRLNGKVPMDINLNMGAGKSTLNLADLNLGQLNVNVGAGEADVYLDGHWAHDVNARFQGGVGKATLHLPRDIGVRVKAEGGLGTVRADGFSRNGDVYTNSAYGKSRVNLNVNIHGGIGEIDLVLGGGRGII